MQQKIIGVILAGGSGTRLWPLSRLQLPKQFLAITGQRTLLEATIDRLDPLIGKEDILVVSSAANAYGGRFAALAPNQILLEPCGRNTAPAIALAAHYVMEKEPDAILVILPADHIIKETQAFQACLKRAIDAASEGKLVTLGIDATFPETGFGYLKAIGDGSAARPVQSFREKPDAATATRLLDEGNWYWNSGIFVWKASTLLTALQEYAPDIAKPIQALANAAKTLGWKKAIEKHFAEIPSRSIDHAVMEKARNVWAVPAQIGWSDVGSWDAVFDIADKDSNGNALQGNALALDCRNTLVRAEKRLVATIGLEQVVVVETADAVLVAKRGHSQAVKTIVDQLQARQAREHIEHLTVQRPWGSYTVLEEGPAFKLKRIEVNPGGRLSLQSHKLRSEHWVVIEGVATVTCDTKVSEVRVNESTFIPIGAKHRLENLGTETLRIIEVQVGSYVGEDDIQRYEDSYGRVTQ